MSAALALAKIRKVSLEVVSGPLRGVVFQFSKPLILIGRGMENDVIIEKDIKISRLHVEIRQNNGLITVHNVTDKNAVLLNGQPIKTAIIDGNVKIHIF
jgi:pSer/pThr/pTyr-binding forkhead associated (FHA) protein